MGESLRGLFSRLTWMSGATEHPAGLIPDPSPHSVDASSASAGLPLPPLMTVAETATALGVSTKTIRRMIARGEFPHVRVGRLVRTRAEDILQYIRVNASL